MVGSGLVGSPAMQAYADACNQTHQHGRGDDGKANPRSFDSSLGSRLIILLFSPHNATHAMEARPVLCVTVRGRHPHPSHAKPVNCEADRQCARELRLLHANVTMQFITLGWVAFHGPEPLPHPSICLHLVCVAYMCRSTLLMHAIILVLFIPAKIHVHSGNYDLLCGHESYAQAS